ncbi:3-oxoacyl-[acyl-carrier-protein] synthase-3 [Anaerosolibacter carboniphilus]|uniref:3-oxoacyl-[acyl-carrier-protein] synthase-3 n=1 Tax=Anaerosolibacter carboniphilus TaxID=1417629 RepID=A0A841KM33_9FIRM|nr:beta-ketoacyl-ACP synthase III [Anaerosolibacter carboniphilus]MBB6214311.1 3-oxoacyl-[acyl-carrier-protein] synthase-3 [Anaerosolibacter carboniphilus]
MQQIKILGSGKYLPARIVTSAEIDRKIGVAEGWSEKKSGVKHRRFVENETASYMGKMAILDALEDAGLNCNDIDCIIGASGSMEQPIPCNAALIQEELGLEDSGIPCFDVNSTCLSFVVGLDMAAYLIEGGRYRNIVLVSSEISSIGLNWEQNESSALFGDGAAAFIIGKSKPEESSRIITSRLETYSKGAHLSEIRGGGSKYHPREHSEQTKGEFLFDMDGQAIFKMTSKLIEGFIHRLFETCNLRMKDMRMVIPHQASKVAMNLVRKRLGIDEGRFMTIIENHGNVIAASIPLALHEAIKQNRIQRGDTVMLLGTSAGLSIGGMIFEY